MKASSNDNHSPQTNHKKGVTCDAMETLERNSDCIDRLTSLVSDMKMNMADGTTIGQVIEVIIIRITIDKVIQDQITDKMPNGLLETEVKVGIEMKTTIMTIQEVEVEIDMTIDRPAQHRREESRSPI